MIDEQDMQMGGVGRRWRYRLVGMEFVKTILGCDFGIVECEIAESFCN